MESASTGGTENNVTPTETDPTEDYLACKGIALENNDNLLLQAVDGSVGYSDAASGSKTLKSLKSLDLVLTDQTNPWLQNGTNTFTTLASFIWRGTAQLATPVTTRVVAHMSNTNAGEIRLFDVTNAVILGTSASLTNTVPAIHTISTSGWSTGPSIIEIQARRTGNAVQCRISSLSLEW